MMLDLEVRFRPGREQSRRFVVELGSDENGSYGVTLFDTKNGNARFVNVNFDGLSDGAALLVLMHVENLAETLNILNAPWTPGKSIEPGVGGDVIEACKNLLRAVTAIEDPGVMTDANTPDPSFCVHGSIEEAVLKQAADALHLEWAPQWRGEEQPTPSKSPEPVAVRAGLAVVDVVPGSKVHGASGATYEGCKGKVTMVGVSTVHVVYTTKTFGTGSMSCMTKEFSKYWVPA